MNRPLTDRERCLQLAAENAALRAEVEAWRANDRDAQLGDQAAFRADIARRFLGRGGQVARLLLVFIDNPGRVLSRDELLDAVCDNPEDHFDPRAHLGGVILKLRGDLAKLGYPLSVENIWGQGFTMPPNIAAKLRTALFGEVA